MLSSKLQWSWMRKVICLLNTEANKIEYNFIFILYVYSHCINCTRCSCLIYSHLNTARKQNLSHVSCCDDVQSKMRYSFQILIVFIEMTSKSFRSQHLNVYCICMSCCCCWWCCTLHSWLLSSSLSLPDTPLSDTQFIMLLEFRVDEPNKWEKVKQQEKWNNKLVNKFTWNDSLNKPSTHTHIQPTKYTKKIQPESKKKGNG